MRFELEVLLALVVSKVGVIATLLGEDDDAPGPGTQAGPASSSRTCRTSIASSRAQAGALDRLLGSGEFNMRRRQRRRPPQTGGARRTGLRTRPSTDRRGKKEIEKSHGPVSPEL